MLCSTNLPRFGDKQNSDFFEEYLQRLLEERDRSGLTEMIGGIEALMISVEPGNSVEYIAELALMTPYQYLVTLDSDKHMTHVLRIDMKSPDILLREVKHPEQSDIFRSLNDLYPVGAKRPHSRYLGEILLAGDRHSVVAQQQQREFRFFSVGELAELDLPLKWGQFHLIAYASQVDVEPHIALCKGPVGRLDSLSCREFEARLLKALSESGTVVVDCAAMVYISSAGLRSLLVAAKQARASNGQLALAALRDNPREVFDISGFSTIFSIHPTVAAAITSFG